MAGQSSLIGVGYFEAARVLEFSVCLWIQVDYMNLGRQGCHAAQASLGGHSIPWGRGRGVGILDQCFSTFMLL